MYMNFHVFPSHRRRNKGKALRSALARDRASILQIELDIPGFSKARRTVSPWASRAQNYGTVLT